jgi:phenylalanyl-tRNA synthetase beta chain
MRGDAFVWISTNGNKWGYIRLIPEHEIEKKDVSLVIVSAALDWETILKLHLEGRKAIELEPLPRYPSSKRDLALVVPQSITYEQIEKAIKKSAGELLVDLRLFDIYRGKQIEKGYLSMAFNLTFQDPERTLTDEIVDERINAILTALKEHGVLLRDK